LELFLSRNDAITTPSLFFGTAKCRELIVHVEGHITLTSFASFRSFLTFVPDGLIEDMAALLVLQWHQVVLAHSLLQPVQLLVCLQNWITGMGSTVNGGFTL
jgi:hypothetical protein